MQKGLIFHPRLHVLCREPYLWYISDIIYHFMSGGKTCKQMDCRLNVTCFILWLLTFVTKVKGPLFRCYKYKIQYSRNKLARNLNQWKIVRKNLVRSFKKTRFDQKLFHRYVHISYQKQSSYAKCLKSFTAHKLDERILVSYLNLKKSNGWKPIS